MYSYIHTHIHTYMYTYLRRTTEKVGKNAAILRLQVLGEAAKSSTPIASKPEVPAAALVQQEGEGGVSDAKIVSFAQLTGRGKSKKPRVKAQVQAPLIPKTTGIDDASVSYSVKVATPGAVQGLQGYKCGLTGCRPLHKVKIRRLRLYDSKWLLFVDVYELCCNVFLSLCADL